MHEKLTRIDLTLAIKARQREIAAAIIEFEDIDPKKRPDRLSAKAN